MKTGSRFCLAYGKTLIGMTCVKRDPRDLMLTATTMVGSKKTLTERIRRIAAKPRNTLITLIACVLVAILAVGCTFTGPAERKAPAEMESVYLSYLEASKTEWSAAAEQYCHFENPAYQAYILENPQIKRIDDYEILRWEKVHEDLWAV